MLSRPELGAIAGTVLIFVFFGITAGDSGLFSAKGIINFLEVSAQLGILAAAVALLMIAGEFDTLGGFDDRLCRHNHCHSADHVGLARVGLSPFSLTSCAFVGYLNGLIVVHTGLPSFIVTLGSLFMLRGLTLGVTRGITGRTRGLRASMNIPPGTGLHRCLRARF